MGRSLLGFGQDSIGKLLAKDLMLSVVDMTLMSSAYMTDIICGPGLVLPAKPVNLWIVPAPLKPMVIGPTDCSAAPNLPGNAQAMPLDLMDRRPIQAQ
jgi:hypothetical protein